MTPNWYGGIPAVCGGQVRGGRISNNIYDTRTAHVLVVEKKRKMMEQSGGGGTAISYTRRSPSVDKKGTGSLGPHWHSRHAGDSDSACGGRTAGVPIPYVNKSGEDPARRR